MTSTEQAADGEAEGLLDQPTAAPQEAVAALQEAAAAPQEAADLHQPSLKKNSVRVLTFLVPVSLVFATLNGFSNGVTALTISFVFFAFLFSLIWWVSMIELQQIYLEYNSDYLRKFTGVVSGWGPWWFILKDLFTP